MERWECKDCVKRDTDACNFNGIPDGHTYCGAILVDPDHAYRKGITDGVLMFAGYMKMSYDKGMKLGVARADDDIKPKLEEIYQTFINAIDDCVKSYMKWKEYTEEREE